MKLYKVLATIVLVTAIMIPTTFWGLLGTETGSRFVLNKSVSFLPEQIQIQYTDFNGTLLQAFKFSDLEVRVESQQYQLDSLDIAWSPMSLLEGELAIDTIAARGVTLTLAPAEVPETDPGAVELPEIAIPLLIKIERLQVDDLGLYQQATDTRQRLVVAMRSRFRYENANLELTKLHLEHELGAISDAVVEVTTRNDYPLKINGQWRLFEPQDLQVRGETVATGSLKQVNIDTRLLVADQQINLHAIVTEPLAELTYQATIKAKELNLNRMIAGLPAALEGSKLSTEIQLNGDLKAAEVTAETSLGLQTDTQLNLSWAASATTERVTLARLEASYRESTTDDAAEQVLTASGSLRRWGSANPTADLIVEWQTLVIPEMPLDLSLNDGELRFTGPLNDYTVALNQVIKLGNDSFVQELNATGDLTAIELTQLDLQSPHLNLASRGSVAWQNGLKVTAKLERLAVDASQIEALKGWTDNAEQPMSISAAGDFAYQGDVLSIEMFTLRTGDSKVQIAGALPLQRNITTSAEQGIEFSAELNNLSEFAAFVGLDLEGELTTKGMLEGSLDELIVSLHGLTLTERRLGNWQLQESLRVTLQPQNIYASSFSDWCLISEESSICGQQKFSSEAEDGGTSNTASRNSFTLVADAFPLSTLSDIAPDNPAQLFGALRLDTQLTIATADGRLIGSQGDIESSNARVVFPEQQQRVRFEQTHLNWTMDQNDIQASVEIIPTGADGGLTGQVSLTDWQRSGQLDGQVSAEFSDLSLIQSFVPQMTHESGSISANVDLSGTRDQPQYQGVIDVTGEQLGFANVGLLINRFNINIASDDGKTSNLAVAGSAISNGGEISLEGSIDPLKPHFELALKGQNFKVSDTPKLKLEVSPDLVAEYSADGLRLRGEVTVPFAQITQPELGSSVAHSSDVVVYENGEPITAEQQTAVPLDAKLRLTLGDNVRVTAFGFDGLVDGSIEVTDDGVRAPTATGRIAVANGEYEIYGQELQIERGALIYTGGVLENPGLDLRVRRIFETTGLASSVQVGAQIGGTLTDPNLRLFSTPAMPDSQILSYLILGRGPATDNANDSDLQLQAALMLGSQGVDFIGKELKDIFAFDEVGIDSGDSLNSSSFFIGKYLSPRLYVKYGIGLLEPTNTFFLRYELTDKLQLESTSTTEAQGGDLIYIIETN